MSTPSNLAQKVTKMAINIDVLEGIRRQDWNLRSFSMSEGLNKIPTMLTKEECRMLVWTAQMVPTGLGAVIDLGSFLGGSTAHLAHGLSASQPNQHVDAFDQFTIGDDIKQRFLYDWGYPELQGNDMLHLFHQFVESFGKTVAHRCNVEEVIWNGGKIELLFVDVCKGWDSMRNVMRQFYPNLIPNCSVVIHQDFQHYQQPWVVATTEALAEHLKMESWTQENSAIFLCTSQIESHHIEWAIAETRDVNRVFDLLKRAMERFPYSRQREAVWQHITALANNPNAQNTWDLQLS